MDANQYFPTPPDLARRAWAKFNNQDFGRVLEPSAGEGAILESAPWSGRNSRIKVDCLEIDLNRHSLLRSKGWNVVGFDFLAMLDGSSYDSIILNPPFNAGATHTLKAYDLLWSGEVVAIINAETVRNPYTAERKRLLSLISTCGDVEFIEGAFMVEEAERKTPVDVALVHLTKVADFEDGDVLGSVFDGLRQDMNDVDTLAADFEGINAVALPKSEIENSVRLFNVAVEAMRKSVFAESRAARLASMMGRTLGELNQKERPAEVESGLKWVRSEIGDRYDNLKDRAWANLLRGTQVTSKLSSKAQRRLEAEFESVKKMAFDLTTIYGFLHGLVQQQGNIQEAMVCDLFDSIMRNGSENMVFGVGYRGWKSNDKHRAGAMQIRTTRFILPGHSTEPWQKQLDWNSQRFLTDIDRITAMVDGKVAPVIGLVDLFKNHFAELRSGQRLSGTYFDIRYFAQAGTLHVFPRDKTIIRRINLIVGRSRKWLPAAGEAVNPEFWRAWEMAEKIDKEVRAEISRAAAGASSWRHPLNALHSYDHGDAAAQAIEDAVVAVLERKGVNVGLMLAAPSACETPQAALPFLEAA